MGETEKRGGFYGLIKMFGMDSKSLMIGDWVLWNGSDGNVYPFQIVTLGAFEDLPCKPIPLNDDMFTANEFDWNTPCFEVKEYGYTIRYLPKSGKLKINVIKDNKITVKVRVYISNVHELQHALRLCGLSELADNFKLKADEQ